MSRYNPPPYSPHYDFVAMRPMTIGGVDVQRGDAIDKSHFSEQRLRQMFDARMIAPAGFVDSPKPAYLDHGRGKADRLRAEIEREEAEQNSAKGQGNAQPRSSAGAAKAVRADAKKAAAAASPAAAKTVGSKPAAKPSKSPRARRAA